MVFWDCLVKWWQVRLFSQCLKSKYVPTKDNGAHADLQPRSRVWLWKFFFTCPHHVANLSKRMPAEADAWSIPSLWQLLGWCCGWDFGRGGVLFSLWFLGELLLARGRLDQNISVTRKQAAVVVVLSYIFKGCGEPGDELSPGPAECSGWIFRAGRL